MNKYKELYEKDGSDPNIVDEIKESFRTTNDKDWVDLYWASKYLFQYDKTGETDSLIIECLEVALESGLHFEKDKLAFLEMALISKWTIIIFNIVFSVSLLLTMFKKEHQLYFSYE